MDLAMLGSLTLRATVVLGAAALLAWSLKKESAGTRHILWTATFGLLLTLPFAARLMPGWELGILPASLKTTPEPSVVAIAPDVSVVWPEAVTPTPTWVPAIATVPEATFSASAPTVVEWTPTIASTAGTGGFPWTSFLWALWGFGAAAALTSTFVGHVRFRRLVRKGAVVRDPVWLGQIDDLRVRLGIDRPVTLVIDPAVGAPMTGGIRAPVILLPDDATEWTPERRRVVLTHELVHVRRHDALRQVLGRVALAVYWFHPLSWLASRQAAASRELACDEEVLAMGTRPSEYAALLLEMADRRAMPSALCLSMVQPSQLERRVMSILDPKRPHRSSFATGAALVALGVFGISAAVAQPVPRPAEPPQEPLAALAPIPTPTAMAVRAEPVGVPSAVVAPAPVAEPMLETAPEPAVAPFGVPSVPTEMAPLLAPPLPPVATLPQEATCKIEGMRGDFSGRYSSDGGRSQLAGTYNGDRVIQKYDDDLRLCIRAHGDVELSDGWSEIESIGSDGWVVLESEEGVLRRLVVTRGASGFDYEFSIDGRSAAFDARAREWHDAMWTVLGGYAQAMQLRGEVASLRGEIASHHGEVASMRGEIASHHGEVASMRGEIASERGRTASLRGRAAGLTARARVLAREAREAEGRDRERLEQDLAEVELQIQDLRVETAALERSSRISELEAELEDIDHSEEIAELQAEIESYQLAEKTEALEAEIVALDADRRAAEIERRIEPEIERLRRLSRGR